MIEIILIGVMVMENINKYLLGIFALMLMSACSSINQSGRDDSFGWNNHPDPPERDINTSSNYSNNNNDNWQNNLERDGDFYSSYSSNNTTQPEIRYVPVVVPWYSSYNYYYNEPVYYYPGFYISVSWGHYRRPYYSYNYYHTDFYPWDWQDQWYCPWYHYNPYYGNNWGYAYNHHRRDRDDYDNVRHNSDTKNAGFGSRPFGTNRGWQESSTSSAPASTTTRSVRNTNTTGTGSQVGVTTPVNSALGKESTKSNINTNIKTIKTGSEAPSSTEKALITVVSEQIQARQPLLLVIILSLTVVKKIILFLLRENLIQKLNLIDPMII